MQHLCCFVQLPFDKRCRSIVSGQCIHLPSLYIIPFTLILLFPNWALLQRIYKADNATMTLALYTHLKLLHYYNYCHNSINAALATIHEVTSVKLPQSGIHE